jgi:hypothetical protein
VRKTELRVFHLGPLDGLVQAVPIGFELHHVPDENGGVRDDGVYVRRGDSYVWQPNERRLDD